MAGTEETLDILLREMHMFAGSFDRHFESETAYGFLVLLSQALTYNGGYDTFDHVFVHCITPFLLLCSRCFICQMYPV